MPQPAGKIQPRRGGSYGSWVNRFERARLQPGRTGTLEELGFRECVRTDFAV